MSYRVLKLTGDFRAGLASVLVLVFALAADAQTPENPELDIELDEVACRAVKEVSVVYNYDDTPWHATPTSRCHWKYDDIGTFMTKTPFSLRLEGIGRTRCKHATPVTDRTFRLKFSLAGTREPGKDMLISGSVHRYVRDVPVKRDGDVACFEVGQVENTLLGVQFDVEDVRVQLFEEKKVGCGLLLDDIWAMSEAKKSKQVNLTSREIAQGIERQGLEGRQCHAPAIVPFTVIEKSLGGTSRLTIEVK